MNYNNIYNLAVALLQFRQAFYQLTKASKEMPEYDFSIGYPFYLLDFEDITPNVSQWCSIHAAELIKQLPDKVDNPACASCKYMRSGITPSGLCKAPIACSQYPSIPFSKELTLPFFAAQNINIADLPDAEVFLLYKRRMNQIYEEKCNEISSCTPDISSPSNSPNSTCIQ